MTEPKSTTPKASNLAGNETQYLGELTSVGPDRLAQILDIVRTVALVVMAIALVVIA